MRLSVEDATHTYTERERKRQIHTSWPLSNGLFVVKHLSFNPGHNLNLDPLAWSTLCNRKSRLSVLPTHTHTRTDAHTYKQQHTHCTPFSTILHTMFCGRVDILNAFSFVSRSDFLMPYPTLDLSVPVSLSLFVPLSISVPLSLSLCAAAAAVSLISFHLRLNCHKIQLDIKLNSAG